MSERAYVVGDLHLGAGKGDPLEDFEDDDLFARFCERIAGPDTTLLLNGDVIDFAQIEPLEVPKAPAYLLWPESASLIKLETALGKHADFFGGLRTLLGKGGRIRFLVGNHDLDMVWPGVQERMAKALGDPSRAQVAFDLGHVDFHGVHVEHGHHFTPENCPRVKTVWTYPGPDGVLYLERVWGTDFMLQFYNELERTHPYADNVKPMLTVLWHGLKKGWIGGGTVARFLLFLKGRLGAPGLSVLPWSGIFGALLGPKPHDLTPAEAAAAFDDLAWKEVLLERQANPAFVAELHAGLKELAADEQKLAASASKVEAVNPRVVVGVAAPTAGTLGILREDRELRAAKARFKAGATHVVFGHTHAVVDGELGGRLFNYGTWLPALDLKTAAVADRIAREGITKELLKDESMYVRERLAVRIDAAPAGLPADVRLVLHDQI